MAITNNDTPLDTTWQSLNVLSGIPVGQTFQINNKTNSTCLIAEGTQPPEGSTRGVILTPSGLIETTSLIPANSLEIWARVMGTVGTARLSVQTVQNPLFNSSGIMTCSGTLSCLEIIPCGE